DFHVTGVQTCALPICCAGYTRKQLDALTDFVKRPQVGASGLVYLRYNEDGTFKSSVDKFYSAEQQAEWAKAFDAQPGDLLLVMRSEERRVGEEGRSRR